MSRQWLRTYPAEGSLLVLDPQPTDAPTDLAAHCGGLISVRVHTSLMSALIDVGASRPHLVVTSTSPAVGDPAALVSAIRANEAPPPVVLAFDPDDPGLPGAVAAGGLPAVRRPLVGLDLLEVVAAHWPRGHRRRGERIVVGVLELDVDGYSATVGGAPVPLSAAEFGVLVALARVPDRTVTRATLVTQFWAHVTDPRGAVAASILRIRSKLRPFGVDSAITTVRGVGYRLVTDALRELAWTELPTVARPQLQRGCQDARGPTLASMQTSPLRPDCSVSSPRASAGY